MGAPWRGLSTAKLAKNSQPVATHGRGAGHRAGHFGPDPFALGGPCGVRRETYCHSSLACRRHIDRVGAARAAFFRTAAGGFLGSAPTDRQAGGVLFYARVHSVPARCGVCGARPGSRVGQREQRWPRPDEPRLNESRRGRRIFPPRVPAPDHRYRRPAFQARTRRRALHLQLLRRRLRQPGRRRQARARL
jgi:hypothetical protein